MQAKQEDPNKARLLELTQKVNEETWMCMDKYLCAGFAMLSKNFGKVTGNVFEPTCNERGTLVLGADYLELYKKARSTYQPYYEQIISKLNLLKDAAFLDKPAQKPSFDVTPFKWAAEQEYKDPKVKEAFAAYKEAAVKISELDITKLTKLQNKKFLAALDEALKPILNTDAYKKLTKVELAKAPEDVPDGIEFVEGSKDTEETNVPSQVSQSVAKLTKMVAALVNEPSDVQNKFNQIEAAKTEMDKVVAQYLQSEDDENFKKAVEFIKKFKTQVIPALWCLSTLTNLKGNVVGVFEAYAQEVLLELLTEKRNARQQKKYEQKQAAANAEKQKDNTNDRPGDTGNGDGASTETAEGGAEDTKSEDAANTEDTPQDSGNDESKGEGEGEGNEATEKAKSLADAAANLLKIEKANEFTTKYGEWVKAIRELSDKLAEDEGLKPGLEKLKNVDPLEQVLGICSLLNNKAEEKKDNTENDEPSESDTAGSKPDAETAEDAENFAGAESFVQQFLKRLDERLR